MVLSMYACVYVCVHVCLSVSICVCASATVCVIYLCVSVHVSACVSAYQCVSLCVCMGVSSVSVFVCGLARRRYTSLPSWAFFLQHLSSPFLNLKLLCFVVKANITAFLPNKDRITWGAQIKSTFDPILKNIGIFCGENPTADRRRQANLTGVFCLFVLRFYPLSPLANRRMPLSNYTFHLSVSADYGFYLKLKYLVMIGGGWEWEVEYDIILWKLFSLLPFSLLPSPGSCPSPPSHYSSQAAPSPRNVTENSGTGGQAIASYTGPAGQTAADHGDRNSH